MPDFQRLQFDKPEYSYFELAYFGNQADNNRIGMHEASASFYGFSRTISILGHFYSTGKINSHAPKSEVRVYLQTSEDGSFRQIIAAAAVGAVVSTPLTVFVTRAIDSWIPAPDPQTQQIIDLLKEQNELLKKEHLSGTETGKASQENSVTDKFIADQKDQMDVLRSITANSFKDIFRPVGKSADFVGITAGKSRAPIGVVNRRALSLIEADKPDDETIFVVGLVSSFSRSSKTGIMFSRDLGRGFRFEFKTTARLPPEDDFSWSQYYQKPVRVSGRFVRFFDGRVKKFIAEFVERVEDQNI